VPEEKGKREKVRGNRRRCSWQRLFSAASPGLVLVEDVEFFPWLEAHGFAWGDGDFGTGAGIAAYAGLAGLYGEDAETSKFNAVAFHEALLHGFEDCIDSRLGLGPDEPGTLYDTLNQILLDQLALACFRPNLCCKGCMVGRLVTLDEPSLSVFDVGPLFCCKRDRSDLLSSACVLLRW